MTDASQNPAQLDDASLDLVVGGIVASRAPRGLLATGNLPQFGEPPVFVVYQGADGTVTCGSGKLTEDGVNRLPWPMQD